MHCSSVTWQLLLKDMWFWKEVVMVHNCGTLFLFTVNYFILFLPSNPVCIPFSFSSTTIVVSTLHLLDWTGSPLTHLSLSLSLSLVLSLSFCLSVCLCLSVSHCVCLYLTSVVSSEKKNRRANNCKRVELILSRRWCRFVCQYVYIMLYIMLT